MVTHSAGEMDESQYWIVIDAATIERGSVTIHCKAYYSENPISILIPMLSLQKVE